MTQQNKKPNSTSQVDEDEIDLIAIAKTIWEGRKTIIKVTLIFMVIGLFVAILSEKEYTASTTFVPQTTDSKVGGSLGGLAAMAGINLGSMGGDSGISLTLYPQIVNSIPFQKELLQTPLTVEGQIKKISYQDYYTDVYTPGLLVYIKKYTVGLPRLIISAIRAGDGGNQGQSTIKNQFVKLTNKEAKLIKILKSQLVLDINDKEGYVTLSVSLPQAMASSELTYRAVELLQEFVIAFKIQKSKEQLKFIKSRYDEVEIKFKKVQQNLANHMDRNKNVITALGQTTTQALQDEYDLIYGVYSELAKQLEAQYIQVTKDTPVFTVLKPVTIPIEKSKPRRGEILMVWVLVGGVFGIASIFLKEFVKVFIKKWKN